MSLPRSVIGLAMVVLTIAGSVRAGDLWVSPEGTDEGDGTPAKPFQSIERARREVRRRVARGLDDDVTVYLREGTYRITEPLVFGPEDSGTKERSITWSGAPGERAVISGGREIRGWDAGRDGVWRTTIPEARSGAWRFRELFVNGERRPRARYPDDGYLRVEKAGPDRRTSFTYREGDLQRWNDLSSVELLFLHDWSVSRIRVEAIDEESRTVRLADPVGPGSRHFAMDWFEPHPRYRLEGSAAFLDRPGEWRLDGETGELSYRPLPGERPGEVTCIAPFARRLLIVRGDAESGRLVRNLRFTGLSFEHCAWPLPERGYAAGQAGFHERRTGGSGTLREPLPAALHFELAEGCLIERGRIAHLGLSGIWFGRQCRDNTLRATTITDVSGNGVLIGEDRHRTVEGGPWWREAPEQAASSNRVENCVIERCGRQFFGSVGVWVGMAEKTRVAHNVIREHPYTGVSVGWMWNPTPTPCRENRIERNHIHSVMQVLSDGGGIYTLGLQPGTVLAENLIHDVPLNAGRAESNGMFLDEGTTGIVIERNLIYDIDRSPLRFHRATTNLVRDNVLVVGAGTPPVRYNNTREEDIRLEGNTVVDSVPPEALEKARRRAGLESGARTAPD